MIASYQHHTTEVSRLIRSARLIPLCRRAVHNVALPLMVGVFVMASLLGVPAGAASCSTQIYLRRKGRNMYRPAVMPLTFALALLYAVPSYSAPTLTYKTVLAEDTALCHSLEAFYNKHLSSPENDDLGPIENQFGSELKEPGPVFLNGDSQYVPGLPSWQRTLLYNLRIYNDRQERTITLNDFSANSDIVLMESQLLILRPGVVAGSLKEVGGGSNFIDEANPDIELSIDFAAGGSSASTKLSRDYYYLRKYPRFDTLLSEERRNISALSHNKKVANIVTAPSIGQSVIQHIVRYGGSVFVVAREHVIEPDARILVYSIHSSGDIKDICYLELTMDREKSGKRRFQ